jgi:hypothetical protein
MVIKRWIGELNNGCDRARRALLGLWEKHIREVTNMSKLQQDLQDEWEELKESLNSQEVIRGIRILAKISAEFAGIASIAIAEITCINIITGGLSSLGLGISSMAVYQSLRPYLTKLTEWYEDLDYEDRMAVKKTLVFFHLGPNMLF